MKTNIIKKALVEQLKKLPATKNNGTQIVDVVETGEDAFDAYPVIRVVPANIVEQITADTRQMLYTVNFVVSVYLDLGKADVPNKEVLDTLTEITDSIYETTFEDDSWLPEIEGFEFFTVDGASSNTIDTIQSKTGTAVFCDIVLPVSYARAV